MVEMKEERMDQEQSERTISNQADTRPRDLTPNENQPVRKFITLSTLSP